MNKDLISKQSLAFWNRWKRGGICSFQPLMHQNNV